MCAALGFDACPCYEDVGILPELPNASNVFDCLFASLLCQNVLPCILLYVFSLLFVFVRRVVSKFTDAIILIVLSGLFSDFLLEPLD